MNGDEDDVERYEEERELELYREYRDVAPMFAYAVETDRRFYLANHIEVDEHESGWLEIRLSDAWVWDVFRRARFVATVRVLTRHEVNIEELRQGEEPTIPT